MNTVPEQKLFACKRCKRQSAVEEVFVKEKRFFGLLTRRFCPDCMLKRLRLDAITNFIILPLVGVLLYFISPLHRLGEAALIIGISLFLYIPFAIVHELAHAAVASLLGFRVFSILLGVGGRVVSGKFLGLKWDVRSLPLGGATILGGPPAPGYQWKHFFVYLAGPASHALLAFLFGSAFVPLLFLDVPPLLTTFCLICASLNLFSLLANLWPRKVPTVYGEGGTDGWHLLRVFFWKPEDFQKRYALYYALEALDANEERQPLQARDWAAKGLALYPDDEMLLNVSGVIHTYLNDFARAREIFVRLLERPKLMPGSKFIILNNIAYADAELNDPALLPEADQYSAEAYQNVPWEPAIQGTRGLVLVLLGKPDEGLPLLHSAFKKSLTRRNKAIDACYIALGELRRGNRAEAGKYLDAARTLDPECPVIARIEQEMAG